MEESTASTKAAGSELPENASWRAEWRLGAFVGEVWVPLEVLEELADRPRNTEVTAQDPCLPPPEVKKALVAAGLAAEQTRGGVYAGPAFAEWWEKLAFPESPGKMSEKTRQQVSHLQDEAAAEASLEVTLGKARAGWAERSVKDKVLSSFILGTDEGYKLRRKEERAGEEPLDFEAFRSLLAKGFHTAFRKATDHSYAAAIWKLIQVMPEGDWLAVTRFAAGPVWGSLRDGGIDQAEITDEDRARLSTLVTQILAHLTVEDDASEKATALRILIGQVFLLGTSTGFENGKMAKKNEEKPK